MYMLFVWLVLGRCVARWCLSLCSFLTLRLHWGLAQAHSKQLSGLRSISLCPLFRSSFTGHSICRQTEIFFLQICLTVSQMENIGSQLELRVEVTRAERKHFWCDWQWLPKSNDWNRGPTELVQHFRLQGESRRRQSAAWHKFDMVWLHRSPIPEGGGGYFTRSNDFYMSSLHLEEGGGGQHPVPKTYTLHGYGASIV